MIVHNLYKMQSISDKQVTKGVGLSIKQLSHVNDNQPNLSQQITSAKTPYHLLVKEKIKTP